MDTSCSGKKIEAMVFDYLTQWEGTTAQLIRRTGCRLQVLKLIPRMASGAN